jgi:hypothetical protein
MAPVSSAEAMPPLLCPPDPVIVLKFALKNSESAEIRRPHWDQPRPTKAIQLPASKPSGCGYAARRGGSV